MPPDSQDRGLPLVAEASDGRETIDFGGWPAALIMPPVIIAWFVLGMGLPPSPGAFNALYLVAAVPVIVGVAGFRRRGAKRASAKVVRGLGWVYLAIAPIFAIGLVLP